MHVAIFHTKMASARIIVAAAAASSAILAGALNPVVPNVGMADPHVHVFGGKYFMYATHDFASNNTNFRMDDWWVWSSPDLVTWTQVSTLTPEETPATPSEFDECWATDGATVNGSYYFYFSMGPANIGVVKSDVSPGGPWSNSLGKPLINDALGPSLNPPTTSRDPCVFQDSDGSHYIIFGVFEYYVARLGPDMMSLAETPLHIQIINPLGPYGNKTDDKPFMHKANGLYYLSWGCFYGIGSSPYGPFTYTGSAIDTNYISPDFRMNVTTGPWYSWEDYMDRHGSFWAANGQWYYASNDRSHSTDPQPAYFRDTVVGYVDYYSNGTMKPVVIDGTGVGEYRALELAYSLQVEEEATTVQHVRDSLRDQYTGRGDGAFDALRGYVADLTVGGWQAEHYGSISHALKGHDHTGRFGVHGISQDSVISYPNVRSGQRDIHNDTVGFWLRYASSRSGHAAGAVVTVRAGRGGRAAGTSAATSGSASSAQGMDDTVESVVLCRLTLPATASWQDYGVASCTVDALALTTPVHGHRALQGQAESTPNRLRELDLDLALSFEGNPTQESELARLDAMGFFTVTTRPK